jgi:hypothetical protein
MNTSCRDRLANNIKTGKSDKRAQRALDFSPEK